MFSSQLSGASRLIALNDGCIALPLSLQMMSENSCWVYGVRWKYRAWTSDTRVKWLKFENPLHVCPPPPIQYKTTFKGDTKQRGPCQWECSETEKHLICDRVCWRLAFGKSQKCGHEYCHFDKIYDLSNETCTCGRNVRWAMSKSHLCSLLLKPVVHQGAWSDYCVCSYFTGVWQQPKMLGIEELCHRYGFVPVLCLWSLQSVRGFLLLLDVCSLFLGMAASCFTRL